MHKLVLLLLISILALVVLGPSLLAHFYLNLGFVNLSQAELAASGPAAVAHSQRAERLFEQAAQYAETYQAARRGQGFNLLARGDKAGAVAAWQDAQISAASLLVFGENMIEQRQWEQALIWYECAAQLDLAASANAWAGLLQERKNYAASFQVWQQALHSFPEHSQRLSWWQGLAHSLRAREQWQAAVQTSRTALSEFPDDPSLLTGLGMALYYGGEGLEAATDVIQRAIALDEDLAWSFATMAQIMAREKQYERAYTWYSKAIARKSDTEWWYVARANVARSAGKLPLALKSYQQAIELYPEYAAVYYEISWAYYLTGEQERAVAAIEQALELAHTSSLNYYIRAGQIYEWANQPDEALAVYQQALELAPDNQRVKDALQRLEGK